MKIRFSDNQLHLKFNPLTLTRPVATMRFGIMTIAETWAHLFRAKGIEIDSYYQTEAYLQVQYPDTETPDITIAGNVKPTSTLVETILNLNTDERLIINGEWIASKNEGKIDKIHSADAPLSVKAIWELFQKNGEAIKIDFDLITAGRTSAPISATNQVMGGDQIFLEPGAKVECAILNATTGPIYIGKDAEVMEGAMIRGGFALGPHSTVKMGAKIYGPTSIGPESKVGGEISNSLIQGYSNKGHDGFIGNSVIGEWCNFGADTNSSNLKNNYSTVKIYDFETKALSLTDNMFCGVLMGDHSKTGINTMLNTATTVGVSANVFGAEFPPKFIPSFSWGVTDTFDFEKAMVVATNMMKRRNIELSDEARTVLRYLFDQN